VLTALKEDVIESSNRDSRFAAAEVSGAVSSPRLKVVRDERFAA
jgi:hypothetical protein